MIRMIFSIVLAVSMAGCNAAATRETSPATGTAADRWREKILVEKRHVLERGQPRTVSRGAEPEIVLRKNQLSYNGRPLTLGSDLNAWRQVLGPETACDGDYSEHGIHCWNHLGIWVGMSRQRSDRVADLHVFLNPKKDPFSDYGPGISAVDGKPAPEGIDIYHDHLFTGYLELDGAGVDAKTKVWEIADLASANYTYKCIRELSSCSIGPVDRRYAMYFSTDGGLEEGLIYEFEMSLIEY